MKCPLCANEMIGVKLIFDNNMSSVWECPACKSCNLLFSIKENVWFMNKKPYTQEEFRRLLNLKAFW